MKQVESEAPRSASQNPGLSHGAVFMSSGAQGPWNMNFHTVDTSLGKHSNSLGTRGCYGHPSA